MAPEFKSAERVVDSSDEDTETSTPTQSLKQQLNGINSKSKPAKTKDDSASDTSEAESDASSRSAKSAASSTSTKTSSSTSSSKPKRKATSAARPAAAKKAKTTSSDQSSLQNVKRIEAKTFVPPPGYTASSIAASDFSSKTNNIFDDLDGKQIWYISGPSMMPVSELESLDVSAALKGVPVLEHGGITYTMGSSNEIMPTLLLPKGTRGDYATVDAKISRSLQIREAPQLASAAATNGDSHKDEEVTEPVSFFATHKGTKKPPRKQPENLRTRWAAFGAEQENSDHGQKRKEREDIVMEDVDVVPSTPLEDVGNDDTIPRSEKKKKKKEKHVNSSQDVDMVNATPKSDKKSKHREAASGDSPVVEKKKKKRKDKPAQI